MFRNAELICSWFQVRRTKSYVCEIIWSAVPRTTLLLAHPIGGHRMRTRTYVASAQAQPTTLRWLNANNNNLRQHQLHGSRLKLRRHQLASLCLEHLVVVRSPDLLVSFFIWDNLSEYLFVIASKSIRRIKFDLFLVALVLTTTWNSLKWSFRFQVYKLSAISSELRICNLTAFRRTPKTKKMWQLSKFLGISMI